MSKKSEEIKKDTKVEETKVEKVLTLEERVESILKRTRVASTPKEEIQLKDLGSTIEDNRFKDGICELFIDCIHFAQKIVNLEKDNYDEKDIKEFENKLRNGYFFQEEQSIFLEQGKGRKLLFLSEVDDKYLVSSMSNTKKKVFDLEDERLDFETEQTNFMEKEIKKRKKENEKKESKKKSSKLQKEQEIKQLRKSVLGVLGTMTKEETDLMKPFLKLEVFGGVVNGEKDITILITELKDKLLEIQQKKLAKDNK